MVPDHEVGAAKHSAYLRVEGTVVDPDGNVIRFGSPERT